MQLLTGKHPMPYKNVSELPSGVKNSLPVEAQRIWMSAFNFSYRKYPAWDEGRRAQYAWGAVERRFKKDAKGNWQKLSMSESFINDDDEHILSANDLLDAAEFVIKELTKLQQNT